MSKQQREYMLRQQLQAIQQELGEQTPEKAEVERTAPPARRVQTCPPRLARKPSRELGRMERLPPAAPDHQVIRSYLELVLELPWKKATLDVIDLVHTRKVLDEDHYGLDDTKERRYPRRPGGPGKQPRCAADPAAWSACPASARRRWVSRSPAHRWGGSSAASAWADFTTRQSCAAIGGRYISAMRWTSDSRARAGRRQ